MRVLMLEDDRDFSRALSRAMQGRFEVLEARNVEEAKACVAEGVAVALVDLFLAGGQNGKPEGLEFLKWLVDQRPAVPALVLTGRGDIELAVEAMKAGAEDFIDKGRLNVAELEKRILDTLERRKLRQENESLRVRLERYEARVLVGESAVMQDLRRVVRTVAEDGQITVLLRGETGTGKELAARMVHETGVRRNGPFMGVDVSCLPKEMIASELFGHERGAFTGADKLRKGYIEEASGGILFLDEITDLPVDLQNRLVRVLEERVVIRLGSTVPLRVDVQLLAATNRDIEEMVRRGEFRKDLYYRLKVFEITLPGLRDHSTDIPGIVKHFLAQWQARTTVRTVEPETMDLLVRYTWPGNVRELRNVLEYAVIQAKMQQAATLAPEHLPIEVKTGGSPSVGSEKTGAGFDVETAMAHAELECVLRALRQTGGSKEAARRLLGYRDRHTMRRRVESIASENPEVWSAYPEIESYYGSANKRKSKQA